MKRPTVPLARKLRRQETEAEKRLWQHLRDRRLGGFKFRRQEPRGRYVADFVCLERQLIVEIDGGQHAERAHDDAQRTAALERDGFRVLRFWNNEALGNTEDVLQVILNALEERGAPSPLPLPKGRGRRGVLRKDPDLEEDSECVPSPRRGEG